MFICVDLTASFLETYSVQSSFVPGDTWTILLDALAKDVVLHHTRGNCPSPSQTRMNSTQLQVLVPIICFFSTDLRPIKRNGGNLTSKIHLRKFTWVLLLSFQPGLGGLVLCFKRMLFLFSEHGGSITSNHLNLKCTTEMFCNSDTKHLI